jgi:hypothetical protein
MRKIDGYALTLAAILGVPYVLAPLLREDFDASGPPEAPPNASIVLASSGSATTVYETVRDEQIDMGPAPTISAHATKKKPA